MKCLSAIRLFGIAALATLLCLGAVSAWASDDLKSAPGSGRESPRKILGLFDSQREPDPRQSRIHRLLDMPLNHLGMVVEYHDIATGLPDPASLKGVRGVITFFDGPVPDSQRYLDWASAVMDRGVRYVVMGNPGIVLGSGHTDVRLDRFNDFLGRLGLRAENRYVAKSHRIKVVYQTPWMMEFERPINGLLPGYDIIRATDPAVKVHLTLQEGNRGETRGDLVTVGPHGGFVASGYAVYSEFDSSAILWWINPFEYLRAAFADGVEPIPDTTTIVGRRLYYSHINGDGWSGLAEVRDPSDKPHKAAGVFLAHAVAAYPDLPVTVAPIAASLHPEESGDERDREIARSFFLLPQVEAGSHTWSHPPDWQVSDTGTGTAEAITPPRSVPKHPVVLDQEIGGSVAYIDSLLPPGKRTRILQWSDDASPSEAALRAAGQVGIVSINGPESRLDGDSPSCSQVPALGFPVGAERQVYASANSEDSYTAFWSARFHGFRYLEHSIARTETPYRTKPFNIYYHMYSGSRTESLNALLANLALARASRITPVATSAFAAIVQGFYSAQLFDLGESRWRIEQRGDLQTIRFDKATFSAVEFSRSHGVLGQIHHQGSLYVALDPAEAAPIIALHDVADPSRGEVANRPYLVDSRWLISDLALNDGSWTFTAQGFGAGEMVWQASPGTYTIRVNRTPPGVVAAAASASAAPEAIAVVTTAGDGILSFTLNADAIAPLRVQIDRGKGS